MNVLWFLCRARCVFMCIDFKKSAYINTFLPLRGFGRNSIEKPKKRRKFVISNREEMSSAEVQLISTNFDNETRSSVFTLGFFLSVYFSFHKQKRTCFVEKKLKKPTYFFQRKKVFFRCSFLTFLFYEKITLNP